MLHFFTYLPAAICNGFTNKNQFGRSIIFYLSEPVLPYKMKIRQNILSKTNNC
jgi:hypothetical protein